MRYCLNCKQKVSPVDYGIGWGILTFLGLLFWIIPGLIIMGIRSTVYGKCPLCRSKHWKNEDHKPVKRKTSTKKKTTKKKVTKRKKITKKKTTRKKKK